MTEFRSKGKGNERKIYPIQKATDQVMEVSITGAELKAPTAKSLEASARDMVKAISEATTVDQMLLELKKYTGFLGQYSSYNSFLINRQDPNATIVRNAQEWKRFGRAVKPDAEFISILYPIGGHHTSPGQMKEFIEKKRAEGLSDEEIEAQVTEKFPKEYNHTHVFGVGKVYDISQTVKTDKSGGDDITVYKVSQLYDALKTIAKRYYKVEETTVPNARGVTYHSGDSTHIEVMKVPGEDVDTFHTLIHEMSHARLDHVKTGTKENYGEHEGEAELSAYLVASHYGIDTMHDSAIYISSWLKGKKMGEENIDRSMTNARWIIQQIDDQVAVKK